MRRLILLAALALGATAVQAENGVFYLGAGVTNGSLTDTSNGVATDLKNTSWKAFAGVRPFKWVAVEADYIDLGSGSNSPFSNTQIITTHADASAWAAYVVGFLPVSLPVVDFYAKAGFARWKLNSNYTQYDPNFPNSVYTASSSSTGSDFAWGIGVQARFSIVGVRLEYEGLDVHSNYTQVASLSLFLNL
jgi:Outer membrane protein beta-barrel domain